MDTDRNVLLAVVALRAGLLDGDQFATACDRWAGQQSKPLSDFLVQPGMLTAEDRTHADYLLERQLPKHGGSAKAAISALADANVRSALAGVRDPELRDWIANVLPGGLYLGAEAGGRRGRGFWIAVIAAVALLVLMVGGGVVFIAIFVAREQSMARDYAMRAQEVRAVADRTAVQGEAQFDRQTVELLLAGLPAKAKGRGEVLESLVEKSRERLQKSPNDMTARLSAAGANELLGDHYRKAGQLQKAENAWQQAERLYSDLYGKQPNLPRTRRDLARAQARLGEIYREQSKLSEAENTLNNAISSLQHLMQTASYENQGPYQYDLAAALIQRAQVFQLNLAANGTARAEQDYAQALGYLQSLLPRYPQNREYPFELARGHHARAKMLQAASRDPEALAAIQQAVSTLEILVKQDAKEESYRTELAAAYLISAALLRKDATGAKAADDLTQKAKVLSEKKE